MLTATTRLHIYWHWYRGRLLVAASLHAAVVLLCYEEYRQIRHPTLQISGMHYFVIVAIALIAWCMSREYVGALSQESSALAPAALDQLPYLHEGTISTRVAALVQIIVLGLFVCCGTVVIAFREWLSESWPTTTAIVESKDFRNGGVRVMFTLQIDGQSHRAEVTRTGSEASLRYVFASCEPGTFHTLRYNPNSPTEVTTVWDSWRVLRADRYLLFIALVSLASAFFAAKDTAESS